MTKAAFAEATTKSATTCARRISAWRAVRVLFDAVAILLGPDDEEKVTSMPQAQNFLRDAFVHGKFIGHALANTLFERSGLIGKADEGCFDLGLVDDGDAMADFIAACATLRHWTRSGLA